MSISLDIDLQALQRQLSAQLTLLERQVVPRASKIALQRMKVTLRKEAGLAIRGELKISAAKAKDPKTIDIRVGDGVIVITVSAKPIGLKEFGAKQQKAGVSYKIGPRTPRKIYRTNRGGSFFVAKLGKHVFVRTSDNPPGRDKAKITKLSGPSAAGAFLRSNVQDRLKQVAQDRFALEFQRAVTGLTR